MPRLLAATFMLPTLVILADAMGLYERVHGVGARRRTSPRSDFIEGLRLGFGTFQVVYSLLKATMFGVAIALVCAYEGYITEAGAEGVGRSTARAVVITSVTILVLDALTAACSVPFCRT